MSLKDNLSGVSLNGKPLTPEILAKLYPKRVRTRTFTNGISRSLDMPEPEPDFTQWILMNGVQYLLADKEPIERSGHGLLGAQRYDPDSDKLKCGECGDWFITYTNHILNSPVKHPSAKQYRHKYQLRNRTALVGLRHALADRERRKSDPTIQDRMARARKALAEKRKAGGYCGGGGRKMTVEGHNVTGHCPVQIPQRLQTFAVQLGRNPKARELRAANIDYRIVLYRFGSLRNALRKARLVK